MIEVSIDKVKDVVKTLPIGYYVGRNVKTKVEDQYNASFYSVNDDQIVVSYSQISKAFENVVDESKTEEIIRSLLYHEVSHSMITPTNLHESCRRTYYGYRYNLTSKDVKNAVNIFEDERIETLLRNYYMSVNFNSLLHLITSPKEEYGSFMEMFFDIVRFRKGDDDLVEEVSRLILKYRSLSRNSDESSYDKEKITCRRYVDDIITLLDRVARRFNQKKSEENNKNSDDNDSSSDDSSKGSSDSTEKESNENSEDNVSCSESEEDNDDSSEDEVLGGIESNDNDESTEDSEPIDKCGSDPSYSSEEVNRIFNQVINCYKNDRLIQDFERIFNSSSKIKKMNGSATNSYSGVFDPRSAGRDDYRFFVRKANNGSNRGSSKIKVNLFLDRSGSFENDVQKANEILYALSCIERKYKNFKFSLITCGIGETIEDDNRREHYANDGTEISSEVFEIFKAVQDKDAVNFNVVLYDGLAWTNGRPVTRYSPSRGKSYVYGDPANFAAFNHNNVVIITDYSNETPCRFYCSKARVEIVKYYEDYAEKLIPTLLASLESITR